MSWWNFGGILNPINDLKNITMGTVHLVTEPSVQIHKYIEPAVISALPAVAAGAACLTGVLCAPAIAGALGTYGAQAAQQGIGGLLGGKTPNIGDFAIGAGIAGGTYAVEAATSGSLMSPLSQGYNIFNPAATTMANTAGSTVASTSGNLLTSSGWNTAMANLGTTAGSTAGSTSWLGTLGSSLSSVGSTLSSGLSDTLSVLSTAAKTLAIAATGMEAYSMISGRNASGATAGQCNTAQSQAQQFGSIAQTFNNDYQAVTASNASQTLLTLQSLYSQANQLGSAIISSGSACVDSTVANQIQQTLSQMQTAISNLQTALGQTPSATASSTTTSGVSSTCTANQQQFSTLVGEFNSMANQSPSSSLYSELLGLYQQAQNIGQSIQSDSTCGTSSIMSIVQNSLSNMQSDLQQVANDLTNQGILTSSIQPTMSSSSAYTTSTPTSSSANTATSSIASALESNPKILPVVVVGGLALTGGLIWYALS